MLQGSYDQGLAQALSLLTLTAATIAAITLQPKEYFFANNSGDGLYCNVVGRLTATREREITVTLQA
ncbi:hypothetical protein RRG08_003475 [Elysia crispata]|uniref:Uncharacterized protein n=1 Tax=Elysia crispata TaxID=231223 RepID=A0AAE0Y6A3_9GAST|nr:hypothetical protein RRG08_003475 [Elysia crispata]